jgi:iron complex outermembrane recepter protein
MKATATTNRSMQPSLGTSLIAAVLTAGLAGGFSSAAHAQQAADPEAATGDIIVTATRRAAAAQDVPAAIQAFTSQAIDSAGIEKPIDFIGLTSNVNLVETQNAGNAFIVIRGITQARNSEPSVAVIVDGVQQVNPAQFNQELFDIEQIEVLKGPQGGLYGRNAIGGAIVIRTKQPTDTFEGRFKAGIDNGFGYTLQGGVSGPISDKVKFRVAANWYDTDGFIKNTFLNEDADPVKDFGVRGALLVQATDQLSFDLRASYNRLETQALYFNIVNDVNDTSKLVRVNNRGQNDRDLVNVSLKITHESDIGTFTSITSYDTVSEILTGDAFDFLPIRDSFFFNLFEFLFGAGNGFDLNQSQFLDVKAWSQEFRFTSPSDQPFRWIVGGYMVGTDRYISTGNMIDTNQGVFPVYRTPSTNPRNPQFSFLADKQTNFAWAMFANASYDITDQLTFDVSLRYDKDRRKNTTLTPTNFLPNVPGFPPGRTGEVRRKSFDAWQPKFTITYEPTDTLTVYGGFSKGFRSGGFNQTGVGAVAASNGIVGVEDIFKAETAETFEIGAKAQAFDKRLNIAASAYTTKSKNSYFFVFLAANSTQNLGNVPEVQLKGFEIDASARVFPGFDLNVGVGYTFSDIKKFADPTVNGNEAPLVSRYTLNLGGQFTHAITDEVIGVARVDYRRIGRTWFDIANSTSRDPVDLVNLRVGLEYKNVTLTGFAENLFDERYNAEFSPGGFVFKARPRRYGAELLAKF